jgi:hypothetical protein
MATFGPVAVIHAPTSLVGLSRESNRRLRSRRMRGTSLKDSPGGQFLHLPAKVKRSDIYRFDHPGNPPVLRGGSIVTDKDLEAEGAIMPPKVLSNPLKLYPQLMWFGYERCCQFEPTYPLAVASVSSSFFVCAASAGIRARRASSASRK